MGDKCDRWAGKLAPRTARMQASEIRELLKLINREDIISFAGGIPAKELLPTRAAAEAAAEILSDPELGTQALQYAASEGYAPLRGWLANYMTQQGVPCEADHILLTSGSQQALDFLGKLLCGPGDIMAVTWPTYLGALQAFNAYEPTYRQLKLDAPDLQAAAAGYLVSDFANPTGTSLTLAERQRVIQAAAVADCPLIEDAAYRDLRFAGEVLPSCLALDIQRTKHIDRSLVVYCGTFSKTLSPGLRVGWICAARSMIQKLVLTKQAADLHDSLLNQMIVHRLAEQTFEQQVAANVACYSERRDAMAAALRRSMPAGYRWAQPEGGMFFWLEGPTNLDFHALLPDVIEQARVAYVPGGAFFADASGRHHMRLNFSMNSPTRLIDGVERLASFLANQPAKTIVL